LAVEGLGRFELEEHVPRIAKVLESAHWQVRNSAANALGQAVFRTDGDEVVDILLEHLLVEENAEVRGSIARTLGRVYF
jgi:HEAT repeat protein